GRGVPETETPRPDHRTIDALAARGCHLTQQDRRIAKASLVREIAGVQSSARCDSKPASGNRRDVQAGAAQSNPVAERNHNRLVARSSIYRNIAIMAVRPRA